MTEAQKTKTAGADVEPAATPDELDAKLDQGFPPTWQPEAEGDTIKGAFLRLEQGTTQFGPAPIVILGTDDGERSVWLFAESLKSAFRRQQPAPGERIAIRYEGEQAVKNPKPGRKTTARVFRVAVDRPAVAQRDVDWGAALGGDAAGGDEDRPDDDIPY